MADPVIPGGIRTQFILPGRTGIPEDRYITTWAFRTEDNLPPSEADLIGANDLVGEFFTGMTSPATTTIANQLGSVIDKPVCEARSYKLGDTVPRQPTTSFYNLGPVSANDPLPSEVAVCASFYSQRNLPRRRGRVFVGPWNASIVTRDTDTGVARLANNIITALRTSMVRLAGSAPQQGLRWCVLSQTDAALYDITAGWVDNAFDTQRRRGETASSRSPWPS